MASLFAALAAIPQFLELAEQFANWIISQVEAYKKAQALADFKTAEENTQKTKDTSQLDAIFDPAKSSSNGKK